MEQFKSSMLDLVIQTSTNLPADVRVAMSEAMAKETAGTQSSSALDVIATNIDMAINGVGAICQDTGMPTFEIHTPAGANQVVMRKQIEEAVAEATKLGKLRPNSVDSITGKNSGDNLGPGTTIIHFHQWERDAIEVKLILKGGGCENTNAQYALPMELPHLGRVDRTLDGVRKCILHAVWQAQGQGCSPGGIGVCIGSDRPGGYACAKQQLFRPLDDVNPDPKLAALEQYIMLTSNTLGIGTMGFGGDVTLIGCKIASQNRLPASFFVSVAYNCWAFRRLGVVLDAKTGAIKRWLYRDASLTPKDMGTTEGFRLTGKEIALTSPISESDIRKLNVGDIVLLNGEMFTGRDAVHAHLMKNPAPVDLNGGVIYHCGPVVLKEGDTWKMGAAGPTTSIREEPYQADIIKRFGLRAVIGKGGMGAKTLAGLKESGAVYLQAIGGAAQYYSRCIKSVKNVYWMEFGIPEALWNIEVENFPAIVTMDSHGKSLHADVEDASGIILSKLADPVF